MVFSYHHLPNDPPLPTISDQCPSRAFTQLGIVPLLCGSASTLYAESLKARLRSAAPGCVVEERFLGPEDLANIYSQTVLNVHPALYDAYGVCVCGGDGGVG